MGLSSGVLQVVGVVAFAGGLGCRVRDGWFWLGAIDRLADQGEASSGLAMIGGFCSDGVGADVKLVIFFYIYFLICLLLLLLLLP